MVKWLQKAAPLLVIVSNPVKSFQRCFEFNGLFELIWKLGNQFCKFPNEALFDK